MTVPFLTQVDKLVQLLESPIFAHVRLQLLEPSQNPYLVKTLFGILMLLPQSSAYELLKNRLKSVSTLSLTNWILKEKEVLNPIASPRRQSSIPVPQDSEPESAPSSPTHKSRLDWKAMFNHFSSIQAKLIPPQTQ
eukprot:NODE_9047_length_624_cov_29.235529_g8419_i0.p1 GENE.NODE_9047_length_624_cov_29.235529_g8419_i0~~NODE_9047_length_624_cov_29.235529_g8419_i0.p1  ORF type:complete len:151 (+),score=31.68 NODE_9047_length_624_cov_29.235529_g8419_i0:46-453(+)